jgi:hypothetical protein
MLQLHAVAIDPWTHDYLILLPHPEGVGDPGFMYVTVAEPHPALQVEERDG